MRGTSRALWRTENERMTPKQVTSRRLELGLSVAELAAILNLTENELLQIERGHCGKVVFDAIEDAFGMLEERLFATYAGP